MRKYQTPYISDGDDIVRRATQDIIKDRRNNLILFPVIFLLLVLLFFSLIAYDNYYVAKYWVPGDIAFRHGDYNTALRDYKSYSRRAPGNAMIHLAIERALVMLGRKKEGRDELLRGIDRAYGMKNNDRLLKRLTDELTRLDESN